MVLALLFPWSNGLLVIFSAIILLFLLKSINLKDRLWLFAFVAALLIAAVTIYQIVGYNNLIEQLRDREAKIAALEKEYQEKKLKIASARSSFDSATKDVAGSRSELDAVRKKANAEFDRTISEIKTIYADISDEELDRRFNDAVTKARRNFKNNVFK